MGTVLTLSPANFVTIGFMVLILGATYGAFMNYKKRMG